MVTMEICRQIEVDQTSTLHVPSLNCLGWSLRIASSQSLGRRYTINTCTNHHCKGSWAEGDLTGSMFTLYSFVELTPPRAVSLKEAAKKVLTKKLVWGIGNVF